MKQFLFYLILFCFFFACTTNKESTEQKIKDYLPISYFKTLQLKIKTPASNGKIVERPFHLYSLLNNSKDTLFVTSVNFSELKELTGYNLLYQKSFRFHNTSKNTWSSTAATNQSLASEADSSYLLPGKSFVFYFELSQATDIDSASFLMEVKIKRGNIFKDTLIRKRFVKPINGRFTEAQGNW